MSVLQTFGKASVLVIGDVMLDEYVWGDVKRISPEAPVPVVEFRTRSHVLGGAANAAANVTSLGAHAFLGGVVGGDAEADILRKELTKSSIDARLVASGDRPTTTKTRILGGSQQILRIDREERKQISNETESSLLEWAEGHFASIGSVLISDYGKGVVTQRLCQGLVEIARGANKPVVVDPKGRDYSKYVGATVLTPNVGEVHLAVEPLSLSTGDLAEDVTKLHSLLPGTSMLVTRGPEGVSVFRPDESELYMPARERNVFDVTGAGDTFAATLALSLAAGATLEEAATLANAAAGIVVAKIGTGTVDPAELEAEFTAR
jgi:D-beta-D-heptose 7-phosphate kinase/D-beta-D-heptose 1-phosphate adenosyltransferase